MVFKQYKVRRSEAEEGRFDGNNRNMYCPVAALALLSLTQVGLVRHQEKMTTYHLETENL